MKKSLLFSAGICTLYFCSALTPVTYADDLNPVTFHTTPQNPPVVLVENHKPIGALMLVGKPSDAVETAVEELQTCVELTTGTKLPVTSTLSALPTLIIGENAQTKAAGLDSSNLPEEGFAIKTTPNRIFIVGKGMGQQWGIYEFLERYLGVRWYWPVDRGGRSIEPKSTLSVPAVYLTDAPVFRKRTIYPPFGRSVALNGEVQNLRDLWPMLRAASSWPVENNVHVPRDWPQKYLATRPEVFQMEKDGSRNPAMLSWGHPRTLETYLEEIDAHYAGRAPADFINGNNISVSPNDMAVVDYAPESRRLWDEKAGDYGSASRIMADFVSRLALEVQKRWPDKTIIYQAYVNYTQAPAGYKFPGNVEVQVCGMPGIAQYKEPAILQADQHNIDQWYEISGRPLQTWHYSCWPADRVKAPYQYPHVLKSYYQNNRNKLVGTFINGDEDEWPRHHISLYAWLKVLWNPDFNVDAFLDEYCRRMYGPAAKTMRQLVQLECDGWEKSRWPGGFLSPKGIYEVSFPKERVAQMRQLLEESRVAAANDPLSLKRVEYHASCFPAFVKEYETLVEGKGVRELVIKKVAENPKIDGVLDDEGWKKASASQLFRLQDDKETPAKFPTEARAVFTLDGVTFGFKMTEPNPKALNRVLKSNDAPGMWVQDCVEIFIDPSNQNLGKFTQLIVNANGNYWDAQNNDSTWNSKGVRAASALGDGFWSMEVFVPYSDLGDKVPFSTGASWIGQLTRHRMSDYEGGEENSRLNNRFGGFSSNLADFTPFRFEE